jgi:hypothetical protein
MSQLNLIHVQQYDLLANRLNPNAGSLIAQPTGQLKVEFTMDWNLQ